jgi:hypothetical protein
MNIVNIAAALLFVATCTIEGAPSRAKLNKENIPKKSQPALQAIERRAGRVDNDLHAIAKVLQKLREDQNRMLKDITNLANAIHNNQPLPPSNL